MELVGTNTFGQYNLKKFSEQDKDGYGTAELAKGQMTKLREAGNHALTYGRNPFTIMELFSSGVEYR